MSLNNITAAAYYPTSQEVYTGTDFNSLNWFEKQWASWYLLIGNPVIATGLASFLLHEVSISQVEFYKYSSCYVAVGVLWSLRTVDYHRCYSLLPQVEASTWQNTFSQGTMGMHETGFVLPFYY